MRVSLGGPHIRYSLRNKAIIRYSVKMTYSLTLFKTYILAFWFIRYPLSLKSEAPYSLFVKKSPHYSLFLKKKGHYSLFGKPQRAPLEALWFPRKSLFTRVTVVYLVETQRNLRRDNGILVLETQIPKSHSKTIKSQIPVKIKSQNPEANNIESQNPVLKMSKSQIPANFKSQNPK